MILKIHRETTYISVWKWLPTGCMCGVLPLFLLCCARSCFTQTVCWLLWATNGQHFRASWKWTLRSILGPFSRGNVNKSVRVSAHHRQAWGRSCTAPKSYSVTSDI